jgi:hypothetical protein
MGKYEGNARDNLHFREYTTTRRVVDVGVQATRSRRYTEVRAPYTQESIGGR